MKLFLALGWRENKALQYSHSAFIAHAQMLCIWLLGYICIPLPLQIILCNCFVRSQNKLFKSTFKGRTCERVLDQLLELNYENPQ